MKISCKLKLNSQITNALKYRGVRNACWRCSVDNNISITIEMYVGSWVSVVKLDVQCDCYLLRPLFLIASAIARWIDEFLQFIPCVWLCFWKIFNVFISLYVLVEYLFRDVSNYIIKQLKVIGIWRSVFLSDIVRDIFIEIIGNRICCVATSPILLNSELFSTRSITYYIKIFLQHYK